MSVALLEAAAAALGELKREVVFLGGATVTLWVTDPAAPPARPTKDVDVVVEATTRLGFEQFQERLRSAFTEDRESGVICRWKSRVGALALDVMPARAELLGFENRWLSEALPHAVERRLPSATTIRAVSPPYLVATKLEAFRGRGGGDYYGSRDVADVVALLDGRAEIVEEVRASPPGLRRYLADHLARIVEDRRGLEGLAAHLPMDAASQERLEAIVIPRIEAIVSRASS